MSTNIIKKDDYQRGLLQRNLEQTVNDYVQYILSEAQSIEQKAQKGGYSEGYRLAKTKISDKEKEFDVKIAYMLNDIESKLCDLTSCMIEKTSLGTGNSDDVSALIRKGLSKLDIPEIADKTIYQTDESV